MEDRERDVQDGFTEEEAFITKQETQIDFKHYFSKRREQSRTKQHEQERTNMEHEFFKLTTLQDICKETSRD